MSRVSTGHLAGWPLVGWCSLALLGMTAAILAWNGTGEAGSRVLIRASAQTSFVLFMSAFCASALCRTYPTGLTRWMLTNRRYLGVSFAVSHFIHLAAILTLARTSAEFANQLNATTIIGGGGAYVFIALMTATSFDRSAAWLGPRAWKRLHTIGIYYIWTIFFVSYLPRAIIESPAYAPFVIVQLTGVAIRAYARFRRREITRHPSLVTDSK